MAGAKGPSTAGFGTRSECKKWALAKTNASHNPSRDAQCAAVISSTWGAKLIARATRVPRYRMSSASIRHGGRFLRRDAGYGEALKQIKLHEGFALRHAQTLEDFPMHHFHQYSSIMEGGSVDFVLEDVPNELGPAKKRRSTFYRCCKPRPAHLPPAPSEAASECMPMARFSCVQRCGSQLTDLQTSGWRRSLPSHRRGSATRAVGDGSRTCPPRRADGAAR